MIKQIFVEQAPLYWAKGFRVIPVPPGTKAGITCWNHYIDQLPNPKTRDEWLKAYPNHGIGLLTGFKVGKDHNLIGIDIDDDRYVEPVKRMIGKVVSAKKGQKGLTIFVLGEPSIKKTAIPKIMDILVRSVCVLPPTIHPKTGLPYTWEGIPLLECDLETLPVLSLEKFQIIQAILKNPNHEGLMK